MPDPSLGRKVFRGAKGFSPLLEQIASEVHGCTKCPLCRLRTQAVPGEGPAQAEIMFIGEGPGYHEDRQGRPFVGASGQLLEGLLAGLPMLAASGPLARSQVFITNVIKCRPPQNRDPLPQEIEACRFHLDRQIEAINPLVIVTLGRYSMGRFFPPTAQITRIHGQPLHQEDRIILPLFHPAAALRNPQWEQDMRRDFATLPALLAEMRQRRQPPSPEPPDLQQLDLF